MNWPLKDTTSAKAGFLEMLATFLFFIIGTGVGVVVYPFANFYLISGKLPTSSDAQDIFDGLRENVYSILLSCIVGGLYALLSIFSLKLGRYIGTFITLLEQIVIYSALYYFAIWIMWKVNSFPGTTVFTMIPYFIYMLAAVLTLELAAIFGQSGRIAYNFVCLGAILGSFIGILRSVDLTYFPVSSNIVLNKDLGIAFARSLVDTTFFLGACTLASACIARSKIGGSFFWHIGAFILPIGLACGFATSSSLADQLAPIIASDTARWIVASLIAVITVIFALVVFAPIRKQAHAAKNQQTRVSSLMASRQPAMAQGRVVATGPIAANAVILV